MQLFLTDFVNDTEMVIIDDIKLIQQIRKVLRLKIWSMFRLQKMIQDTNTIEIIRIKVIIDKWDDKHIYTKQLQEEKKSLKNIQNPTSMLIAMPNKWQKAELIVQKLSEIGIQNIYFRPSERSVIKTKNTNKRLRLEKIAKEAVEQSRWWMIPNIQFVDQLNIFLKQQQDVNLVLFDLDANQHTPLENTNIPKKCLGIIWPEGGFSDRDLQLFQHYHKPLSFQLWDTVLRMETASIIASWLLYNR